MSNKEQKENKAAVETKAAEYRYFRPLADIIETEKDLSVHIDMPGVSKDQVTVKVDKNILAVEGLIKAQEEENFTSLSKEYGVGHYARQFRLSDELDKENIDAKMDSGILTLVLKKLAETKAHQVSIH